MHTELSVTGIEQEEEDKSCGESCESYDSSENIGLLNLPSLILDEIFSHLSPTDILTLRLTCTSTKSWIEDKFLDRLCLTVKTSDTFRTLLSPSSSSSSCRTSWTNFSFVWKLTPSSKQLMAFTLLYSGTISSLQFTSAVIDSAIIKILSACSGLRILIIQEIDGTTLGELGAKDKARFSSAISSLQHLGIMEILSDDKKGADFFINDILTRCAPSLKSLVVPFLTFSPINAYPFKYSWDKRYLTSTTPTDVLVVRPLIELLEVRDKAPNLESIVVIPESRSGLSDSALFCLTLMSYHRRLNLVYDKYCDGGANFHNNFHLGRLKYQSPSSGETGNLTISEIASKIMTVMSSTTDLLLNYEFANLRKLIVQFSTFHIDQDIFVVQNFPRLRVLQIDFKIRKQLSPRCSKIQRMAMFVQGILEVERPTVRELQIQNHSVVETMIPLNGGKIVSCFINLRNLSLTGFKGGGKDFAGIWRGLRLLERVELENCPGLNDYGILGEDWTKPAILELTDLRELKISRTGRITDLSYIIALSRMRLTRFHHQPLYPSDVTFEGYNSLARGDFSKTIKFLSGSTTHYGRHQRDALSEYLDNFQSLQDSERRRILRGFNRWRKFTCF